MKFNLLDNLTCPTCNYYPLDIHNQKTISNESLTINIGQYSKCNEYCGITKSKIQIHETYPCKECRLTSILDGILVCRECNTEYEIKDGIPYMLKERDDFRYGHWDTLYSNPDVGQIKKNIMHLLQNKAALTTYYALINLGKQKKLKSIKSVEIGCGSGAYSLMLKKMDLIQEPYLIDISPQALHLASNLFDEFDEECHLILTDGNALPFRDQSFDLSLSSGVIEHFKGTEQQNLISEHCRVAKNVACQVPASTVGYWLMRAIITILHNGWPFGKEYPMHMHDLENGFMTEQYIVTDISYHDLFTAALFVLSNKYKWIHPLEQKSWINKLFKHEIVVIAHKK